MLCIILATTSCGGTGDETQQVPTGDGKHSLEDFTKSVGRFPYTAPRGRRDRILKGFEKLDVGVTKEQVVAALGEPDYSELAYTKGAKPRWLGSSWIYYISKRSEEANSFDPLVHIFFGTDDRAVWIVPNNIQGLYEKGSPSRSRT